MKKRIIAVCCVLLLISGIVYIWHGNRTVRLTETEFSSDRLSAAFDGFTVAHVSDLHNASFGKDQKRLLAQVRGANPDMIVVTGDIIDSRRTDTEPALTFMREALEIAPVYYVTGNHEARIDEFPEFEQELLSLGVTVMRNETAEIERGGEKIYLVGIDDPLFIMRGEALTESEAVMRELDGQGGDGFTLLLAHRPELIEDYASFGADLVLSGHAHGGQIRIPFIGGLYAPGQGFFPEYTSGEISFGGTSGIVSRGLGNSLFPFRVNNDPEVVAIKLRRG